MEGFVRKPSSVTRREARESKDKKELAPDYHLSACNFT
jgi:hypothetical protein